MKNLVMIIAAALLASACTNIDTYVRPKVADAYDAALAQAKRTTCNDVSVGSVLRTYGTSKERAEAWRKFCFGDEDAKFILTNPEENE